MARKRRVPLMNGGEEEISDLGTGDSPPTAVSATYNSFRGTSTWYGEHLADLTLVAVETFIALWLWLSFDGGCV